MKTEICIIGAGPAGLMAAIHAAREGVTTTVLEANAEAGRKLLITGSGRCNFTHAATPDEMVRAFGTGGRFLRHCFHELSPAEIITFFRRHGLPGKVEPDGCVFPVSDRAGDVRDLLVRQARKLGARLAFREPVRDVAGSDAGFTVRTPQRTIPTRRLIVATGGVTWPQTGSTGDGYRFAAAFGHGIAPARPALVTLVTREKWLRDLAGVSVADVRMRTRIGSRKIATEGAMIFTHKGIGGPATLDLSRHAADYLATQGRSIDLEIDLAPETGTDALDRQMREQWAAHPKKNTANALPAFLPHRLALALCDRAACDPKSPAGQVTKDARRRLVALLKALPLRVTGTGPIEEATVTRGGVRTKEIDPQTMESKLRPGLFFAGEILDVDGPCGGYNLQMCFSTGALAGRAAAGMA